ncbi:B12-binding domain-containing radical SAM protein [Siminovitchia sediminis]|uniref:B12-binding domain-containing radical SAM protein n=1 Tax=Siminovitchia sediminis TaxID=1274353 RepID=A0ABW4KQM4_9BACI
MKILSVWPPHVPSYFNAGHHLPIFQVGAYLRNLPFVEEVNCLDAGVLNLTWKDISDYLVQGEYDLIAIMNDFDAIDDLKRFIKYIRTLSPKTKIITFGRLSKQVPNFFKKFDLDAIVHSGDNEAGVAAYIQYLNSNSENNPPGVYVRNEEQWTEEYIPGTFLEADEWALPNIQEIPYEHYDFMYRRDQNKFCGIPERRELVVPLARGCPIGCEFCDVSKLQGLRERRLPVQQVLSYIEDSFEKLPFDYVTFYAPTFTLKRRWVLEFCSELIKRERNYPWKCVTTTYHLDEQLIELMARSGCFRISIGIETLDPAAGDSLPRIKREAEEKFESVANWCLKHGIELNCFVILGLPGESVEGARYTIQRIIDKKARVRPTIYTPYNLMDEEMDEDMISSFNRQLFVDGIVDENDAIEFYQMFFGKGYSPTQIMKKIPKNEQISL